MTNVLVVETSHDMGYGEMVIIGEDMDFIERVYSPMHENWFSPGDMREYEVYDVTPKEDFTPPVPDSEIMTWVWGMEQDFYKSIKETDPLKALKMKMGGDCIDFKVLDKNEYDAKEHIRKDWMSVYEFEDNGPCVLCRKRKFVKVPKMNDYLRHEIEGMDEYAGHEDEVWNKFVEWYEQDRFVYNEEYIRTILGIIRPDYNIINIISM